MHKLKTISMILVFLLIPVILIIGFLKTPNQKYYIPAIAVVVLSMLPFLLRIRSLKLRAREMVVMSSIIAIAVISRVAFYSVPAVKPMCGILIIAASVFGADIGFAFGALAMLLSNFVFGQGPFTPFQMFSMGLAVFAASAVIRKLSLKDKPVAAAITGFLSCFVIYGFLIDCASALLMLTEFNRQSIFAIFVSGLKYNLIHALATSVVIFLGIKPISERLERIIIKYGIFEEQRVSNEN